MYILDEAIAFRACSFCEYSAHVANKVYMMFGYVWCWRLKPSYKNEQRVFEKMIMLAISSRNLEICAELIARIMLVEFCTST